VAKLRCLQMFPVTSRMCSSFRGCWQQVGGGGIQGYWKDKDDWNHVYVCVRYLDSYILCV